MSTGSPRRTENLPAELRLLRVAAGIDTELIEADDLELAFLEQLAPPLKALLAPALAGHPEERVEHFRTEARRTALATLRLNEIRSELLSATTEEEAVLVGGAALDQRGYYEPGGSRPCTRIDLFVGGGSAPSVERLLLDRGYGIDRDFLPVREALEHGLHRSDQYRHPSTGIPVRLFWRADFDQEPNRGLEMHQNLRRAPEGRSSGFAEEWAASLLMDLTRARIRGDHTGISTLQRFSFDWMSLVDFARMLSHHPTLDVGALIAGSGTPDAVARVRMPLAVSWAVFGSRGAREALEGEPDLPRFRTEVLSELRQRVDYLVRFAPSRISPYGAGGRDAWQRATANMHRILSEDGDKLSYVARALNILGHRYRDLGDVELARASFARVLRECGECHRWVESAASYLADLLFSEGHRQDAVALLEQQLSTDAWEDDGMGAGLKRIEMLKALWRDAHGSGNRRAIRAVEDRIEEQAERIRHVWWRNGGHFESVKYAKTTERLLEELRKN